MSKDKVVDPSKIPTALPIVQTMDLVAFPGVMLSLYIDDQQSKLAIENAAGEDQYVLLLAESAAQHKGEPEDYLQKVGVIGTVAKQFNLNDGRYKVLIQGMARGRVTSFTKKADLIIANIEYVAESDEIILEPEDEELISTVHEKLRLLVEYEHLPEEILLVTEETEHPGLLSDIIIAHYKLHVEQAQVLLEELDPLKRLQQTATLLQDELRQFVLMEEVRDKTQEELTKGQREYYLREQIKQIQRELGDDSDESEDLAGLEAALAEAQLPKHAKEEADKQIRRLRRMSAESSEYAMLRTYLEWLSDLPWSVTTKDRIDIKGAEKILNTDHYGLEKAKERILEFLSVRKLKQDSKGPILCFVGPPGVGKTSLGKSIAHCLGRKFYRMSLGGVRDEAEMRGHRRTYVGALPGKIIQGLKEAGSNNPVFLLDELDKVGADFRGDPASALLEILDPEQNKDFRDHYLNIPFDLSKCLFIATANTLDTIPSALMDRLEIIRISGYTTDEKVHIAKQYLIPKEIEAHGLIEQKLKFQDKALLYTIERYTQEAGVRGLGREIASLCRKLARQLVEKKNLINIITPAAVEKYLGTPKVDPEEREHKAIVGMARGLAWTIFGGDVMPVEASIAKGKSSLTLTGSLGEVMRESAQTGLFYTRSHAEMYGIDPNFYSNADIHIHVPDGSTPKDGPSAGITIITALVSALTQRPIAADLAMTGEVTLRGNVRAIGGLKEKALAALRQGIKRIIIPEANLKDIEDIPKKQREQLKFIPVNDISQVLEIALLPKARITGKKVKKKVKATLLV
jgi:ATP-dependent Lon protease